MLLALGEVEGLIDPRGAVLLSEFGCVIPDRDCGVAGCMVPVRPCGTFDRGAGLVKVLGCVGCEDCDGAVKLLGWDDCDGLEKVLGCEDWDGAEKVRPDGCP